MGMVDILFNDAETLEQIDNTPLDRKPNLKSGENWSSCFSEKKDFKDYDISYMYIGARTDNPREQIFCCIKGACYFDHTL